MIVLTARAAPHQDESLLDEEARWKCARLFSLHIVFLGLFSRANWGGLRAFVLPEDFTASL